MSYHAWAATLPLWLVLLLGVAGIAGVIGGILRGSLVGIAIGGVVFGLVVSFLGGVDAFFTALRIATAGWTG